MPTHRSTLGATLATTILLATVLLTLAFTLASSSVFHLNVAAQVSNLEQARNLAESAVARGVERLLDSPSYGVIGDADAKSLEIHFDGSRPDIVGRCNGVTRTVETVVNIPRYKYAIATSGTLTSSGGLTVTSVEELADLSGGLASVLAEDLLPGHIAANGTGAALVLSSTAAQPTLVTGDALSGGTAALGPQTTVEGAVIQGADPVELPDMVVEDYDPAGWMGLFELTNPAGYASTLTLEGPVRVTGNLDVIAGGLEIEGAYLYVDGNLDVTGGIIGKGAVFATGSITVDGASVFSTDNVQALVAKGNLSIIGLDKGASYFQGVMFNNGDFYAADITLAGSLANNAPLGETSTFELERANVVHVPEAVSFDFRFPFKARSTIGVPGLMLGPPGPYPEEDYPSYVRADDNIDLAPYYNPITDTIDPNLATAENTPVIYTITGSAFDPVTGSLMSEEFTDSQLLEAADWYITVGNDGGGGPTPEQAEAILLERKDIFLAQFKLNLEDANALYQRTRDPNLIHGSRADCGGPRPAFRSVCDGSHRLRTADRTATLRESTTS